MKNIFISKSIMVIVVITNIAAYIGGLIVLISSLLEGVFSDLSKGLGKEPSGYALLLCLVYILSSGFILLYLDDEIGRGMALDEYKKAADMKILKKMIFPAFEHFTFFAYPIFYYCYTKTGGTNILFFYLAIIIGIWMVLYTVFMLRRRWIVAMG